MTLPASEVLVALYAYTLQIYYDFSAYTDIAIGSALFLESGCQKNFNRPYKATSVAEFWRRWHITLSIGPETTFIIRSVDLKSQPTGRSIETSSPQCSSLGSAWCIVELCGLWDPSRHCRVNQPSPAKAHRPASRMPFDHWSQWLWRFLLTFHFVVIARILFRAEGLYGSVAIQVSP